MRDKVTGEFQKRLNISDSWLLTHRVDLHNTLRAAAAEEVDGRKVDIRLRSRVASVVCLSPMYSIPEMQVLS